MKFTLRHMNDIFRTYKKEVRSQLKPTLESAIISFIGKENNKLRSRCGILEDKESTSPIKAKLTNVEQKKFPLMRQTWTSYHFGGYELYRTIFCRPRENSVYNYYNYRGAMMPDMRLNFVYDLCQFTMLDHRFNCMTDAEFGAEFFSFVTNMIPEIYEHVKEMLYEKLGLYKSEFEISLFKLHSLANSRSKFNLHTNIPNPPENYLFNPCILFSTDYDNFHFKSGDFINRKKLVQFADCITVFPFEKEVFVIKHNGDRYFARYDKRTESEFKLKPYITMSNLDESGMSFQNFFPDGYLPDRMTICNLFNNLVIEIKHLESDVAMHIQQPAFNNPRFLRYLRNEEYANKCAVKTFSNEDLHNEYDQALSDFEKEKCTIYSINYEIADRADRLIQQRINKKLISLLQYNMNGSITNPEMAMLNFTHNALHTYSTRVYDYNSSHFAIKNGRLIQYDADKKLISKPSIPFKMMVDTRINRNNSKDLVNDRVHLQLYSDSKLFEKKAIERLDLDTMIKLRLNEPVNFDNIREQFNNFVERYRKAQDEGRELSAFFIEDALWFKFMLFFRNEIYKRAIIPAIAEVIDENKNLFDVESRCDMARLKSVWEKRYKIEYELRKERESIMKVDILRPFSKFGTVMTEVLYKNCGTFNPEYRLIDLNKV